MAVKSSALFLVCLAFFSAQCSSSLKDYDIQRLLEDEQKFVKVLRRLVKINCPISAVLKKYINTNYWHSIFNLKSDYATLKENEQFISHPVTILMLFKRLGYDFEHRNPKNTNLAGLSQKNLLKIPYLQFSKLKNHHFYNPRSLKLQLVLTLD